MGILGRKSLQTTNLAGRLPVTCLMKSFHFSGGNHTVYSCFSLAKPAHCQARHFLWATFSISIAQSSLTAFRNERRVEKWCVTLNSREIAASKLPWMRPKPVEIRASITGENNLMEILPFRRAAALQLPGM